MLIRRGEIQNNGSKITVPLLGGNKGKDILGLIDRISKRCLIVKFLHQKFPMLDEDQKELALRFATFVDYDKYLPFVGRQSVGDLTWMSQRSPACAAVTNLMKRIWDGEMDEYIRLGMKSLSASATALELITMSDTFKTCYINVESEYDLATNASVATAAAPDVSIGAAGAKAAVSSESRDAMCAADPEVAQLWNKAAFRRAGSCSFIVGGGQPELLQQIKDSIAAKVNGCVGSKHVAVIGDFGVLADCGSRPWQKPPNYHQSCQPRMTAGREFFEMEGFDHVIMIYFDSSRESNRAPIRKLYETSDANLGIGLSHFKENKTREFFIQSPARAGQKFRGCGAAQDVEMMFVKTRSQPVSHIKKKPRLHHEGTTASVMYGSVVRPIFKRLPQVDFATKTAIFGDVSPQCNDSLKEEKMMKKQRLPRQARGALPLNWWERSSRFYEKILDTFNIASVVDLFGSTNAAIACVTAEPPKPYVCLCRNQAHVRAMS